jgi:hypothetical protein
MEVGADNGDVNTRGWALAVDRYSIHFGSTTTFQTP